MTSKLTSALLLSLTIFSQFAYAKLTIHTRPPRVYDVKNNDLVQVALSAVDLNRIVVADDKVKSVHCPAKFCTVDKERDSSGGILLSIASGARATDNGMRFAPFTMFIDTQKGKHFSVLIVPIDAPSVTAIFNIKPNAQQAIAARQKSMPYVQFLGTLMKQSVFAFENKTTIPDFLKYEVSTKYHMCNSEKIGAGCIYQGKINILPVAVYHGGQYNVIVDRLYNPTTTGIKIDRSKFYVRGLSALAIVPDYKVLEGKSSAYMYQIVDGTGTAARKEYE